MNPLLLETWQGDDRRYDTDTAQTLTYAINMSKVLGLSQALSFLGNYTIKEEVVERVLLEVKRRGTKEVQCDSPCRKD